MNNEFRKTEPNAFQPEVHFRLLWWLVIYTVAQLPWVLFYPGIFFLFPTSLLALLPKWIQDGNPSHKALEVAIIGVSYGFYAIHLSSCFYFRGKKAFLILIGILLLLVILTAVGLWIAAMEQL